MSSTQPSSTNFPRKMGIGGIMLIQPGNTKLGKQTYMFNLPATQAVCGRVCAGCYAAREQVRFKSILDAREVRFNASLDPLFATNIVKELKALKKPPKYFRIHASGEFYSQWYLNQWKLIAAALPNIIFYAYTKRLTDFDFSAIKALPNVVIINSLHYGKLNYGKLVDAPVGSFICPTGTDDTIQCGVNCTHCMTKQAEVQGVYFLKH